MTQLLVLTGVLLCSLMMCPTPLSLSVLEASFTSQTLGADARAATASDKLNLLTALATAPAYAAQRVSTSTN